MRLLWKKYKKDHFDLNLDECGIHQCTPLNHYAYTISQDYILHYCLEGTGYVEAGGQKHIVRAGDMFLFQKGMNAAYYPDIVHPWKYCWIGFSGTLARKYINKTSLFKTCVFTLSDGCELPGLINTFTTAIYQDESRDSELFRLQYLYQILFSLCREFHIDEDHRRCSLINQNLEKAIDYMNRRYKEPINISDVSQHLCITRSYLYKLFMQNMSVSPQNYLIQIRLFHASQLLKTTGMSIKEIAYDSGYADQLQFSSQFKRHYQLSPKQYRKEYADAQAREEMQGHE